jgi:hypothetical protein
MIRKSGRARYRILEARRGVHEERFVIRRLLSATWRVALQTGDRTGTLYAMKGR